MKSTLSEFLAKEQKQYAKFKNLNPKVVPPKSMVRHRISNVNNDTMTGNCSACGDVVTVKSLGFYGYKALYACAKVMCDGAERRKERFPDYQKEYALKLNYKLSLEQFNFMFMQQESVCKICKEKPKRICVDHDHACCPGTKSCGKCIRGLICLPCNIGLGNLKDSPTILRLAADYLDNYNFKK